jgi:hypothetical protein
LLTAVLFAADNAYLEGFDAFLQQAATAGERDKGTPGTGAEASGQGHLWRDWASMKTKQRLALLGEMRQVRITADLATLTRQPTELNWAVAGIPNGLGNQLVGF